MLFFLLRFRKWANLHKILHTIDVNTYKTIHFFFCHQMQFVFWFNWNQKYLLIWNLIKCSVFCPMCHSIESLLILCRVQLDSLLWFYFGKITFNNVDNLKRKSPLQFRSTHPNRRIWKKSTWIFSLTIIDKTSVIINFRW